MLQIVIKFISYAVVHDLVRWTIVPARAFCQEFNARGKSYAFAYTVEGFDRTYKLYKFFY